MSTHPNAILILRLTPDGLARKTYRDILSDNGVENIEMDEIKISEHKYSHMVMEGTYDEGYQISAEAGDIVVFELITYRYGESMLFDDLQKQKEELELWAKDTCKKNNCNYKISIGANYW